MIFLYEKHYLEFGKGPRNVRFALSTDGMNPFGEISSTHSTWPMILTMDNLPTWLYKKRKYLLVSILIQGPKLLTPFFGTRQKDNEGNKC